MGDVCTDSPTFTSFVASTEQTFSVSQSTSESVSVGAGTVLTRSIGSGTDAIVTETNIPGATATVPVVIPVTVTGQQVVQIPVLTLFAPCSTSETSSSSSSTPTSTSTPVSSSTPAESTPTSESRTSSQSSTQQAGSSSSAGSGSSNTHQNVTPTPTPTNTSHNNNNSNTSETGTIIVTTSLALTTLPNGSQSSFVATVTTSVAPNGSLNDNTNNSGARSTRAVAIGVGVAGGLVAFIILMLGITWQIRRKRRRLLTGGGDDSDIWGPNHEAKTPQGSPGSRTPGYGYTYNPYGEARTTSYAPVSMTSPPRARPLSLGDSTGGRTPRVSIGGGQPGGLNVVAPLLPRTKTADEILWEAARQDPPRSRTTSATASHHTRGSEVGMSVSMSHRPQGSLTASHMSHTTHGSMSVSGRRTDSVVGLLEHPPTPATNSLHLHDDDPMLRYHDMVEAAEDERPMSPVSVVAPRLAIANPDTERDP